MLKMPAKSKSKSQARVRRQRDRRSLSPVPRNHEEKKEKKERKEPLVHEWKEPGGQVSYFLHIKGFLQDYKHEDALRVFANTLDFPKQRAPAMFGYSTPRDMLWFAEDGTEYKFSGRSHPSGDWKGSGGVLPAISQHLITEITKCITNKPGFMPPILNAVLVNRYLNGKDSIRAHSDDELCLGKNPTVASVSIGATRIMKVARKTQVLFNSEQKKHGYPEGTEVGPSKTLSFELEDGDLFVFGGCAQAFWTHRIDKEEDLPADSVRTNFTFRPHHQERVVTLDHE